MSKIPTKTGGKDLEAFRALHDKSYIVPQKIRDGLKALGESWEYELEFLRRCGVCSTDFAAYRDQFAEHYVEVRGLGKGAKRVWAGTAAFAAKLRGMNP